MNRRVVIAVAVVAGNEQIGIARATPRLDQDVRAVRTARPCKRPDPHGEFHRDPAMSDRSTCESANGTITEERLDESVNVLVLRLLLELPDAKLSLR